MMSGLLKGAIALLLFRTFAIESIHLINSEWYENKNHVRGIVRGDPLARVRGWEWLGAGAGVPWPPNFAAEEAMAVKSGRPFSSRVIKEPFILITFKISG